MPGIDKLPIEETLEDSPQVKRRAAVGDEGEPGDRAQAWGGGGEGVLAVVAGVHPGSGGRRLHPPPRCLRPPRPRPGQRRPGSRLARARAVGPRPTGGAAAAATVVVSHGAWRSRTRRSAFYLTEGSVFIAVL